MAKKDLYVCDFCEATKVMEVDGEDRCPSPLGPFSEVPPGWGLLSLAILAAEPTFEKAHYEFDLAGGAVDGTFERRINLDAPFRMDGIEVTEGPTDGWTLLGLFVGNRAVISDPTPLVQFTAGYRANVQDAFFVAAVSPGMHIRGIFSFDGRRDDMLRSGVSVPQVSVVGEDLLSVGYGDEQRNTGESVLCGSCCKKLSLRIGDREVPLKQNPIHGTIDPMDFYGDVGYGDVPGIPFQAQPFRAGARPMRRPIRQVPMTMMRPMVRARRTW